jgi:hypothetical protein
MMETDLNATVTKCTGEMAEFSDGTSLVRNKAHLNSRFASIDLMSFHPYNFKEICSTPNARVLDILNILNDPDTPRSDEGRPKEAVPLPKVSLINQLADKIQGGYKSEGSLNVASNHADIIFKTQDGVRDGQYPVYTVRSAEKKLLKLEIRFE